MIGIWRGDVYWMVRTESYDACGLYWWRWFVLVICPVDKSLFSEGLQNISCQICCLLISLGYCLQSGDMPCWAICLAGRNSVVGSVNTTVYIWEDAVSSKVSHHSLGQAYSILLLQTLSQTVIHTVRTCGNLWQIMFLCWGDTIDFALQVSWHHA
jgi:hypothetical protein